jgi:hypothetical protein
MLVIVLFHGIPDPQIPGYNQIQYEIFLTQGNPNHYSTVICHSHDAVYMLLFVSTRE